MHNFLNKNSPHLRTAYHSYLACFAHETILQATTRVQIAGVNTRASAIWGIVIGRVVEQPVHWNSMPGFPLRPVHIFSSLMVLRPDAFISLQGLRNDIAHQGPPDDLMVVRCNACSLVTSKQVSAQTSTKYFPYVVHSYLTRHY